MGVAEVERFEGVGRGVMGLLRLWKCVGESKAVRSEYDVKPGENEYST
jgi:hypothetical protein